MVIEIEEAPRPREVDWEKINIVINGGRDVILKFNPTMQSF